MATLVDRTVRMSNTKTIQVPHLFGTTVGYQMPKPYDPQKPTCVLINSFSMTSDLYRAQFEDQRLTDAMNLLAIEPYGHGKTHTNCPTFTYWDTAMMALQALDALDIKGKVFALGTSQGGWIIVRMALLAPDKIAGLIPLGTSMDYESDRTRVNGCFDCPGIATPAIKAFESKDPTPDFVIPDPVCDLSIFTGFGTNLLSADEESFWRDTLKSIYKGEEGRKKLKEIMVNLRDRDGLLGRLFEVKCPVAWIHGTEDAAYSVFNAQEEIPLFVNSPSAKLYVVEGGQHYLSASHPEKVNKLLLDFVQKNA